MTVPRPQWHAARGTSATLLGETQGLPHGQRWWAVRRTQCLASFPLRWWVAPGGESPKGGSNRNGTGLANRHARATFCCGGVGALCGGDTQGPGQSSLGAAKPPRSCRFLLMQDPCGLSIGMPSGGVALRSARQCDLSHWWCFQGSAYMRAPEQHRSRRMNRTNKW